MFRKLLLIVMFALLWLVNGCVLSKYNYKLVEIENSNLCKVNILNLAK